MAYIVAIETDPKSVKDITESWSDIARSLNHKILIKESVAALKTEWEKPEYQGLKMVLILVPVELLGDKPVEFITELKTTYPDCTVLVSLFDNPKFSKNSELWPVQNIIYKPFDATILKEHTRFALLKNQRVQTQYVHTTLAKAEVESLKKFKALQLTEFGFKLNKTYPLVLGHVYKFYHPLFINQKMQHIWARVIAEDNDSYELLFCQINATVLGQIRKKLVATTNRIRGAVWRGRTSATHLKIRIYISVSDPELGIVLTDLLKRKFSIVEFLDKKDISPTGQTKVDLLITDFGYDKKELERQFDPTVTYIRIVSKPVKRKELEERFTLETIRLETPVDKSILVRIIKQLFPLMHENDPSPLSTATFDETVLLSTSMEVSEYSEAAMGIQQTILIPLDTMLDITLTQDDETQLREMKVKVHFVDSKLSADKMYYHQVILFGMKDELLKLIRLWTLQQHIERNKNN